LNRICNSETGYGPFGPGPWGNYPSSHHLDASVKYVYQYTRGDRGHLWVIVKFLTSIHVKKLANFTVRIQNFFEGGVGP
jgi:hypothetical protein